MPGKSSLSDSAEFIKFFFKQDISPRAKFQKERHLKIIKSKLYCKSSIKYWTYFVKYISNLFTSDAEILEAFELVKTDIGIHKWNET